MKSENYTRYAYAVDVDVDDASGKVTAFLHWRDGGEVGPAIAGDFDAETARRIGDGLLRDVHTQNFGDGDGGDEAPGPCVTCGTQCVADGSLAVICPNCEWKERAIALLKALGDLGTQDLYTDADEYRNRVGAMQDLCGMAALMAEGKSVAVEDIEDASRATDSDDEMEETEDGE